MRRIRATLATTEYIPSYGGFRLSLDNLHSMLQTLKAGTVESRLFHDSRRPLHVENEDAGIEQRPDGEYALWVEFDADEKQWAEYEAERDAQGGPGGLSFTLVEAFDELQSRRGQTSISVNVAADAGHFSDQEIRAAAYVLTEVGLRRQVGSINSQLYRRRWQSSSFWFKKEHRFPQESSRHGCMTPFGASAQEEALRPWTWS